MQSRQVKESEYSPYIVWLLWMGYCQLYYLWGKLKILEPLCHIIVPWLSRALGEHQVQSSTHWGTQVLRALLTTYNIQHCVKEAFRLVFSSLVWDYGKGYAVWKQARFYNSNMKVCGLFPYYGWWMSTWKGNTEEVRFIKGRWLGVPFFPLFVMGNSQVENGKDCFSPWTFWKRSSTQMSGRNCCCVYHLERQQRLCLLINRLLPLVRAQDNLCFWLIHQCWYLVVAFSWSL